MQIKDGRYDLISGIQKISTDIIKFILKSDYETWFKNFKEGMYFE